MRCNAYYLTLHDNNVTQFTVKHSSYINARNRLSDRMTYLPIITLAPSPIPSQTDPTHPIQYNFTRCGCSFMSGPRQM